MLTMALSVSMIAGGDQPSVKDKRQNGQKLFGSAVN